MVDAAFRKQLEGYGLTTANIIYRIPDYQDILQTYIWQDYDIHPQFPELRRFLNFWSFSLDGPLYSIVVTHARLIRPVEIKSVGEFLH